MCFAAPQVAAVRCRSSADSHPCCIAAMQGCHLQPCAISALPASAKQCRGGIVYAHSYICFVGIAYCDGHAVYTCSGIGGIVSRGRTTTHLQYCRWAAWRHRSLLAFRAPAMPRSSAASLRADIPASRQPCAPCGALVAGAARTARMRNLPSLGTLRPGMLAAPGPRSRAAAQPAGVAAAAVAGAGLRMRGGLGAARGRGGARMG